MISWSICSTEGLNFGGGYHGVLGVNGVEDALVEDLCLGDEADFAVNVRSVPAHGTTFARACIQADPLLNLTLSTHPPVQSIWSPQQPQENQCGSGCSPSAPIPQLQAPRPFRNSDGILYIYYGSRYCVFMGFLGL